MGTTSGYSGQTPPGFCGTVENEQWLGFIAGAPGATFTATATNCNNGDGIQIALYAGCSAGGPVACNGGTNGGAANPVSVTAALTVGVNYFLLIDGYAGDQCDFTINVVPPSAVQAPPVGITGNISGPITACPGAVVTFSIPPVTGAGAYVWTAPGDWLINGQTPSVTTTAPGGNVVQVTIGTSSGTICVQPLNSCNDGVEKCKAVTVKPIPPTILPKVTICAEDAPYELPWGDYANSSGTYETTETSYQGCDSVVRQQVVIKAPLIKFLAPQSVCAGTCVTVCGDEYCDAGAFAHICESYQGCDSVINFSILVVDPIAEIIPNGTLSCSNTSIILNSTSSPGTKIWKSPAGQVLGSGNSLTVTQAGTYVLTVTASAGGNLCIKNDTIVITGNTIPPTASATGGVLGCGAAQAQITSSTNATTPVYAWGPSTGLNATNIANPIATLAGTYTVTITDNATGCSSTATISVTGNTTPPSVATTGGTLTCTLTSLQLGASTNVPNANYSWSGPGLSSTQQNPTVNAAGTYTVTITNTVNNCTSTGTVTVQQNTTPPVASATGGVISCTNPTIALGGNSPTAGVTYAWTGPVGFTSTQQNPSIDTSGVYNLVVTNPANGCSSTASATATGNTNPPTAAATGGIVSCGTQNISITGSSTTTGASYGWTGPGGFVSSAQNPSVTVPGVYVLTVTGTNSCTFTATATVDGDFVAPEAAATGGVITCSSSSTTINGTSQTPGVVFNWVGPSGNPYAGATPTVSNTGVYTLIVTSPNGCTATATASVMPDANVPNVSAAGGTLNCTINSITLNGGSTTPNTTLQWNGPNGFVSPLEDPTVTEPGDYILTVIDPVNGCTAEAAAIVVLDDAPPGAGATGGVVTCTTPSLALGGTSPETNVSWAWSGPGLNSTEQNPMVTAAGDYQLTVTGGNGCTSTAVATILADQTPPVPASNTGVLTCSTTSLVLNGSANVNVAYAWAGPNGFSSLDQAPTVNAPGDYTLIATGDNGCVDSITVTVGQDILAPEVTASGNTITCTAPQVPLAGNSTTPGTSYAWSGPSFTSTDPNPVVTQNGTYVLVVTGPNGCTSQAVVDVLKDTEAPTLNAQPTAILTCSATSIEIATLATNGSSAIQTFDWSGPGGFVSNLEDPLVQEPGLYTLTVTSANGCTTTTTALVDQDIVAPNVSSQGATLTCIITSATLNGGSTTPNSSFTWSGPGGFASDLEDPIIDVEGVYTLTVTGPNGCTATSSSTVVLDGDFPDALASSSNNLDCNLTETELVGASSTTGVSYSWSDSNGEIIGNTPTVTVALPGVYQVAITAPNGCVTNANVSVTQDITLPEATAVGDTIDCISGQASLIGGSQTASVSWKWTGPNGFTSSLQNPIVSVDGTYDLVVTGANGCTSAASAFVAKNTLSPDAAVDGAGTLTCLVTDLTLTGTINTPGATGVWTDAAGTVLSNNSAITVSDPGVYTFTVTAPNGCKSAPTGTIDENVVTPQNVIVTGGLINCKNPQLTMTAQTSTPNVSYNWTGPGGYMSSIQNPQVGVSGTFTLLLTNLDNGCQATAVTTVTEDFVKPTISVNTQTITCSLPTVVLDATTTPNNVQFQWAGPGISGANQTNNDPSVAAAGTYSVTVTAQNGCTQTSTITVAQDIVHPDVATTGVTLTCTTPSSTISGSSQTPNVTYAWAGPNGYVSTSTTPTVTEAGDYILTVTAPNGCTSTAVAIVKPDATQPSVSATGGTLTCNITSLALAATSNNPNVSWQWTGPAGYTSTTQNPTITVAGNYSITVTAPNGCTSSTNTAVLADTQGPSVNTSVPDELNCTTTQVTLNATVPTPGNYTYQWSTQNGNIVSGAFSQAPIVSSAALYSVVVTNQQNGCSSTEDVPVLVDTNTVSGAVLAVRDVSCYGKTDGIVGINSVIGGTPPFLYSLDNLPFVSAAFFTSLDPGSHPLTIQDANGCEWLTSIEIGEPEELLVNLGPDTTIHLGQSITLSLDNTVNYPDRVTSLVLQPTSLDSVLCPTCTGRLEPINSFRYFVTVVDSNGCKATDSRTVIVDKTRLVYIPNVFDPTAPSTNSLFFISGGEDVVEIESFQVYDRWGNAVFEKYNFAPNDPSTGWDGTVRGDLANPAVFVYYAKILFKDQETVLYKGDVTLVRNY
ncbi:MAG: gliding motility-associated C-terminal domain-containing protein [Saprospiraceae bacterium]|nr:gliding motility-associated C-terminal domain-containing protein [Saprospiraceae bacterium]